MPENESGGTKREMSFAEKKIQMYKELRELEEKEKKGEVVSDEFWKKDQPKGTDKRIIALIVVGIVLFVGYFATRLILDKIPPKLLDFRTLGFSQERIEKEVGQRVADYYKEYGKLDINLVDKYTTGKAKNDITQRVASLVVQTKMTSQKFYLEEIEIGRPEIKGDHVEVKASYMMVIQTPTGGTVIPGQGPVVMPGEDPSKIGYKDLLRQRVHETLRLKYYKPGWLIYEMDTASEEPLVAPSPEAITSP
ncbi:MAG: hypothetical protein ACUVXI_12150 [bacterium]